MNQKVVKKINHLRTEKATLRAELQNAKNEEDQDEIQAIEKEIAGIDYEISKLEPHICNEDYEVEDFEDDDADLEIDDDEDEEDDCDEDSAEEE